MDLLVGQFVLNAYGHVVAYASEDYKQDIASRNVTHSASYLTVVANAVYLLLKMILLLYRFAYKLSYHCFARLNATLLPRVSPLMKNAICKKLHWIQV